MGHKAAGAALVAAALIALTGCALPVSNTIEKAGTTTAPAPASTPAAPYVAAFGDSVKFPEGIAVTTKATLQTAGPYAAGAVEGKIVVVEVSVTNNSSQPFDAALVAYPKVTYGAKGLPAGNAVDDMTTGHIGNLLPGETQTATSGYGIPAAGLSDIRIEFDGPKYEDVPAVFKGSVK